MKPGKQRKNIEELPKHQRRKQVAARLTKELAAKYNRRRFTIRKGDKVKILRGTNKGQTGKVTKVDHKTYRITVENVTTKKADGSDTLQPISPSNVMITELDTKDKKRAQSLEGR